MEWWLGVFQNVFSTAIWVTGAFTVGIITGILKKKGSLWAPPILYGLGAFLLVLGVLLSLKAVVALTPTNPPTTTANVEERVKVWLDHLGYSVRTVDNSNDIFAIEATGMRGRIVNIERTKNHDQYLILSADDRFTDADRKIFDGQTPLAKGLLVQGLTLELARTGLLFTQALQSSNLLHVEQHTPITNMTEDSFATQVNAVDEALLLANSFITIQLLPQVERK